MAPPKKTTASPTPGPSAAASGRNLTGDALYTWCTQNYEPGYVFTQTELLGAGIIPNQELPILLTSVDYLVRKSLFRVHDRAGGGIGWELVDPETAKSNEYLCRTTFFRTWDFYNKC